MNISIVTPWLNHSELIPVYERSCDGAQVVVVDNGSEWMHAQRLEQMVSRMGGVYIRNEHNNLFAPANNQGLREATGDIIVCLNNDVECRRGWLDSVLVDTAPNSLAGPSMLTKHGVNYIEGYCIAARRDTWQLLGGWPENLPGMYWEDNILCLEARQKGIALIQTNWPVWHYSNYTSRQTHGAYDTSAANEAEFLRRLANAR